jgi:hypothetical protein
MDNVQTILNRHNPNRTLAEDEPVRQAESDPEIRTDGNYVNPFESEDDDAPDDSVPGVLSTTQRKNIVEYECLYNITSDHDGVSSDEYDTFLDGVYDAPLLDNQDNFPGTSADNQDNSPGTSADNQGTFAENNHNTPGTSAEIFSAQRYPGTSADNQGTSAENNHNTPGTSAEIFSAHRYPGTSADNQSDFAENNHNTPGTSAEIFSAHRYPDGTSWRSPPSHTPPVGSYSGGTSDNDGHSIFDRAPPSQTPPTASSSTVIFRGKRGNSSHRFKKDIPVKKTSFFAEKNKVLLQSFFILNLF